MVQLITNSWQCFTLDKRCHGDELAYNELCTTIPFFVKNDFANILDHVPPFLKPNGLQPFDVRQENAVAKIQYAWHNAIENPNFFLCKRRLNREFDELVKA
jgi:hypothetical protein